jgi:hypothetical protein
MVLGRIHLANRGDDFVRQPTISACPIYIRPCAHTTVVGDDDLLLQSFDIGPYIKVYWAVGWGRIGTMYN